MREKLRILWKSNAPHVGSGYGVQANSLLPRLAKHPLIEQIGIFGYFGIMGGLTELPVGRGIPRVRPKNMLHYPIGNDMWGNDVVWEHAKNFDADLVITLLDLWVLKEDYGWGGFLHCPYMPIDHEPIPPKILARARQAFHPIAYSQHASKLLAQEEIEHSYIPHGVETDLYHPLTRRQKRAAKRWVGLDPDKYTVGIVAANKGWPSRKGFPELFEAFAGLHNKYPDTQLLIHATIKDQVHGGPDLTALAKLYGIADSVRITAPYFMLLGFSTPEMNKLYNAMDVFCLPSMGEGFGIPIIEAQAAGIPVVVSDWTACPELVGAGQAVPIAKLFPTPLDAYQAFCDVPALTAALVDMYLQTKGGMVFEDQARAFAMQYDWETLVRDKWFPFIDWVAERVLPKSVKWNPHNFAPTEKEAGAVGTETGVADAPTAPAVSTEELVCR